MGSWTHKTIHRGPRQKHKCQRAYKQRRRGSHGGTKVQMPISRPTQFCQRREDAETCLRRTPRTPRRQLLRRTCLRRRGRVSSHKVVRHCPRGKSRNHGPNILINKGTMQVFCDEGIMDTQNWHRHRPPREGLSELEIPPREGSRNASVYTHEQSEEEAESRKQDLLLLLILRLRLLLRAGRTRKLACAAVDAHRGASCCGVRARAAVDACHRARCPRQ
jgi:hypothetical protein